MQFQCRHRSAVYVVRARDFKIDSGFKVPVPGLRAEFSAPGLDESDGPASSAIPAFFDSEAAAAANGWTEEQRLSVERYLLLHSEFGAGLYLAPGQQIPPEHADLPIPNRVREAAGSEEIPKDPEEPGPVCTASWIDELGDVHMCGARVATHGDECAQHGGATQQEKPKAKPKARARKQKAAA